MTDIVSILGEKLVEFTNKTALLNRALIKLAVKDQFNEGDPLKLTLLEWKSTINSAVKARLEKVNVADVSKAVKVLHDTLIEHQSLISMSKF